jgi:hypothetical protein
LENSVLYYKNNNNLAGQNMLTQKALTKNLIATLCTTTNTLFVHNNKNVQHASKVYTQNANKVVRNLTQQQLNAFAQLPKTFMQSAKQFPSVANKTMQQLLNK